MQPLNHSVIIIETNADCVTNSIRSDSTLGSFQKNARLGAVEALKSDAQALDAVLEEENEAGHEALHETQDLLVATCSNYAGFSQTAIESAGAACRNAMP